VSFVRSFLIGLAALGLGWYLASTAAGYADKACWLTTLLGLPSCS
jgi:hypothetical protein